MRLHLVSRLLVGAVGFAVLVVLLVVLRPGPAADRAHLQSATANRNAFDKVGGATLKKGTFAHTEYAGEQVRLSAGQDTGSYTTPWVTPATSFTQLVPSWRATTAKGSWIGIDVRVRTGSRTSSWDADAHWAYGEDQIRRTTFGAQTDDLARMSVDTLLSQVGALRSWQVRVTFHRRTGSVSPSLDRVTAVATLPGSGTMATSRPIHRTAKVLDVPRYSQMIHRGEYPQYGGGGEAWCSPTSLAMILGYYKKLPPASSYAWVKRSYADRWVDAVARLTYDRAYQGTGNWPFNTAIGGSRVGYGFVTRLGSLRDAERYIRAGIPLAASISFGRGELSGAPISATNGHLVVIVGFTADGDVVVNDPAAPSNGSVRRTYDRGQFERAWMRRSLGTVYVVRDEAHPLP